MYELTEMQINDVGGGVTSGQVLTAMGLGLAGVAGVACAPVALAAGLVAASIGLGIAGGTLVLGSGYLLMQQ